MLAKYNNKKYYLSMHIELKTRIHTSCQKGFSLVELAIVLVILGLLVGGVLGGQALMHAAQLRSVTEDFNKYQSAVHAFRDKYRALPGDMPNAVRFWGAQAGTTADGVDATCAALSQDADAAATGTETCNGDGNNQVYGVSWHETWRAWQHLANAGLIDGQYTGVTADDSYVTIGEAGVNMPASRMEGAGFVINYLAPRPLPDGGYFSSRYGNILRFGGGESVDQDPGFITAQDALNVDLKMDDGRPGTGSVLAYRNLYRPNCTSTDDADTAEYLVQQNLKQCNLFFITGF